MATITINKYSGSRELYREGPAATIPSRRDMYTGRCTCHLLPYTYLRSRKYLCNWLLFCINYKVAQVAKTLNSKTIHSTLCSTLYGNIIFTFVYWIQSVDLHGSLQKQQSLKVDQFCNICAKHSLYVRNSSSFSSVDARLFLIQCRRKNTFSGIEFKSN